MSDNTRIGGFWGDVDDATYLNLEDQDGNKIQVKYLPPFLYVGNVQAVGDQLRELREMIDLAINEEDRLDNLPKLEGHGVEDSKEWTVEVWERGQTDPIYVKSYNNEASARRAYARFLRKGDPNVHVQLSEVMR